MQNETEQARGQDNNNKGNRSHRFLKITESPFFWILFVALAFGIPLTRSLLKKPVALPPVLAQLTDFSLVNQNNQKVELRDLMGSVVIANFIFTSCPDTCPLLTGQMAKIQSRMIRVGPAIKLVSFSVDPTKDTPEVLKAYGEKYHANFKIWQFLTGSLDQVKNVLIDGFKVGFDRTGEELSMMDITHSEMFVIFDQLGQIRAYKTAKNTEEIDDIVRIVALLANTKPTPALAR